MVGATARRGFSDTITGPRAVKISSVEGEHLSPYKAFPKEHLATHCFWAEWLLVDLIAFPIITQEQGNATCPSPVCAIVQKYPWKPSQREAIEHRVISRSLSTKIHLEATSKDFSFLIERENWPIASKLRIRNEYLQFLRKTVPFIGNHAALFIKQKVLLCWNFVQKCCFFRLLPMHGFLKICWEHWGRSRWLKCLLIKLADM